MVKDGPDNDYWDDVERAVRLAGEQGLYIGLLPTWGKHVTSNWQSGLVDGFFTVNYSNYADPFGLYVSMIAPAGGGAAWAAGGGVQLGIGGGGGAAVTGGGGGT